MVIKGDAAMQIMGDWAKGEFVNAGKEPDQDFLCFRFPGTQGIVTFNSDQFVIFKVAGRPAGGADCPRDGDAWTRIPVGLQRREGLGAGAYRRARHRLRRLRQEGASPTSRTRARRGRCSARSRMATPCRAAVKNAMYDVITRHFNGQIDHGPGGEGIPHRGEERSRRRRAVASARVCGAGGGPPQEETCMTSMAAPIEARPRPSGQARARLQEWLPRLVLAPTFAIVLLFVYGFILWTIYLSFTRSRLLPVYELAGFDAYQRLWR